MISIHSPHTGRDAGECKLLDYSEDFNPLSPHGERRGMLHYVPYLVEFQSTLPTRGETRAGARGAGTIQISIHSPHTGRDTTYITVSNCHMIFQSTLPTRGETREQASPEWLAIISIHSPHTGRDGPCLGRGYVLLIFQSTLPTRGETSPDHLRRISGAISIHSPHTGRDARVCGLSARTTDFNPLSPHGERQA